MKNSSNLMCLGIIAFSVVLHSCKKDKETPPVLTTAEPEEITQATVSSGGTITSDGGADLIIAGICWSTLPGTSVKDKHTNDTKEPGSFKSKISGLKAETIYYLRAYATNSVGTSYGNELSFTTATLQIDGNICVIGNSTVSEHLGGNAVADYLKYTGSLTDISYPGSSIQGQKDSWDLLSDSTKSALDYVFVQIGLNDLDSDESVEAPLQRYQLLVDGIKAAAPNAKILLGTMIPCKQSLINSYGDIGGLAAYQKWLDMNEAIKGNGANAITGMNGTASIHTVLLNDGNDNLASAYDVGDGKHPNNAGRIIIANSWMAAYELLQSKTALYILPRGVVKNPGRDYLIGTYTINNYLGNKSVDFITAFNINTLPCEKI